MVGLEASQWAIPSNDLGTQTGSSNHPDSTKGRGRGNGRNNHGRSNNNKNKSWHDNAHPRLREYASEMFPDRFSPQNTTPPGNSPSHNSIPPADIPPQHLAALPNSIRPADTASSSSAFTGSLPTPQNSPPPNPTSFVFGAGQDPVTLNKDGRSKASDSDDDSEDDDNEFDNEANPLDDSMPFDTRRIIAALKKNATVQAIIEYCSQYPEEEVKQGLRQAKFIFALVQLSNSTELFHLFLQKELVDPNVENSRKVPVLAHTIMHSKKSGNNVLGLVRLLLAHGAKPEGVPIDMWVEYVHTPKAMPLPKGPAGEKPWTAKRRKVLAETLNMSIRYSLYRADRSPQMFARIKQIAKLHAVTPLFNIAHLIVGQEIAAQQVIDRVFARIAMHSKKPKPLVISFAGLSGHGKTELASQLGSLLSVDMVTIDFTQVQNVYSLFGPPAGYSGHSIGSPLDTFLREHDGKRSVIFLDEYDKSTKTVHNALLKVMESGEYVERKTNKTVYCHESIWILATNTGDSEIKAFYEENKMAVNRDVDITPLQVQLRALFTRLYTPAVCGRINLYVPFFPFTPDEQAVVAHKFFLAMVDDLRQNIDMKPEVLGLVGRSVLCMADDGKVCKLLAQDGYDEETGARSLGNRIDDLASEFVLAYTQTDELVHEEMNEEPWTRFVVKLIRTEGGIEKLRVVREKKAIGETW